MAITRPTNDVKANHANKAGTSYTSPPDLTRLKAEEVEAIRGTILTGEYSVVPFDVYVGGVETIDNARVGYLTELQLETATDRHVSITGEDDPSDVSDVFVRFVRPDGTRFAGMKFGGASSGLTLETDTLLRVRDKDNAASAGVRALTYEVDDNSDFFTIAFGAGVVQTFQTFNLNDPVTKAPRHFLETEDAQQLSISNTSPTDPLIVDIEGGTGQELRLAGFAIAKDLGLISTVESLVMYDGAAANQLVELQADTNDLFISNSAPSGKFNLDITGADGATVAFDGTTVLDSDAIVAVANPTGGATVDTECRAQLVALLTALKNHGLIT